MEGNDDETATEVLDPAKIKFGPKTPYRSFREAWVAQGGTLTPPVHACPRVGRNDSCPCGSGKKFKKCCG